MRTHTWSPCGGGGVVREEDRRRSRQQGPSLPCHPADPKLLQKEGDGVDTL